MNILGGVWWRSKYLKLIMDSLHLKRDSLLIWSDMLRTSFSQTFLMDLVFCNRAYYILRVILHLNQGIEKQSSCFLTIGWLWRIHLINFTIFCNEIFLFSGKWQVFTVKQWLRIQWSHPVHTGIAFSHFSYKLIFYAFEHWSVNVLHITMAAFYIASLETKERFDFHLPIKK